MSAILSTYLPLDTHQPRGKQPWCATCDTDLEMGSPQTPLCTQQRPTDLLEAYLRTRVLRRRCGFQMEKLH